MSDGGAQVIVGGISLLARFTIGRIILAAAAAMLGLRILAGYAGTSVGVLVAALGAGLLVLAVVFSIRRRKRERASMRQVLLFVGFVVIAALGAIVIVLRRRRQQREALVPPDPREIDQLAAAAAMEGRR